MDYEWPGNVRELENVVERAVVLSTGSDLSADLLPENIVGRGTKLAVLEHRPDASLFEIIEDCERRVITDMLEKCSWNQTDAAERFRIPLSTLNQKIKRLNIEIGRREKRTEVISRQQSAVSSQRFVEYQRARRLDSPDQTCQHLLHLLHLQRRACSDSAAEIRSFASMS